MTRKQVYDSTLLNIYNNVTGTIKVVDADEFKKELVVNSIKSMNNDVLYQLGDDLGLYRYE